MINHVFIEPHEDTVDYLQQLFMNVPFEIHWDTLCMEIGSSLIEPQIKSRSVYNAVPGELSIWYDTATACSHLLLPFFPSRKLANRHEELGDAWGRSQFRPVMSFGPLQSNRRHHKAIINSIATALVDTSPVFLFGAESIFTDHAIVAQYSDFYRDYIAQGPIGNQVLLEMDEGVD